MKFIQDKYKSARGGHSRYLQISCAKCGHHICYYQKDGPGELKRMYLDRMIKRRSTKTLTCKKCKLVLGLKYNYKKENRPAYRLFVGAISKKIVAAHRVNNSNK